MTRFIFAIFLIYLVGSSSFGQKINYDDYDNTSRWFLGLDLGHTWHTSDVKNVKKRFPIGAGINLGYSFNQKYSSPISIDLRFRVIGGSWYGQDTKATGSIGNNFAVKQYYDTIGMVVQNFRARQTDFSLELALHFNRLRERYGIDPYIFGGLGYTLTQTKGDLFSEYTEGAGWNIYPYDTHPSGDIIKQEYTVPLDKNSKGKAYNKTRKEASTILPSIGIGIGYFINARWSIGLEHRSTFFRSDYFDGTSVTQEGKPSKFKNDIYHYTSFYIKWYFPKGNITKDRDDHITPPITQPEPETAPQPTNPQPTPTQPTPPNNGRDETTVPTPKRPPIIKFTNPYTTSTVTQDEVFSLVANVQYVNSANELTFTQNGEVYTSFIYTPYNKTFKTDIRLVPGNNIFKLVGVNADGTDQDEVIIFREEETPDGLPPVVNIVSPEYSPYIVNQENYIVKANVQNIQARNQLTVTFNDKPFSDFSFSSQSGVNFSANLTLLSGVNELKIIASNEEGIDMDKTVLIYSRETTPQGTPPTVKIIKPNNKPYNTSKDVEPVEATVTNINEKAQLQVRINGVNTSNFNFNSSTKKVSFNASLMTGMNYITVIATNAFGEASDDIQIILKKAVVLPPTVKIITPEANPYTTSNTVERIVARAENITKRQEIEILDNNRVISIFNFNTSSKLIEFDLPITSESHLVKINVTNTAGSATDSRVIQKKKIVALPPTVKIIIPATNPFTTTGTTQQVVAKVENITQKQQIEVTVNNLIVTNFNFNSSTKQIDISPSLSQESNSVKIKVTNNDGTATDQVTIKVKREPVIEKPIVGFINPATPGLSTSTSIYELKGYVKNVTAKENVTVYLNNEKIDQQKFTFNASNGEIISSVNLKLGKNDFTIKGVNSAGEDMASSSINRVVETKTPIDINIPNTPDPVCGVFIDTKVKEYDVCIQTPTGTYNLNTLTNNTQFTYNGPASGVFFKTSSAGKALVNGADYTLNSGSYYNFIGNLTVEIKRIGINWNICVKSQRRPIVGTNENPILSPCLSTQEKSNENADEDKGNGKGKKPVIETTPNQEEQEKAPHQSTPTREEPTRKPGGR